MYVDEVGLCLPVLSERRVYGHGSASSVGSVASSTKLATAAAGNAVGRPSHCGSSSCDVTNPLVAVQRDEVSEFSFFRLLHFRLCGMLV